MEDATRALLIVAGVFFAIMILTIGGYLISTLDQTAETFTTELDIVEIRKYNSNFDVFIGRNDITAQEIVTLISFVQQKGQETIVFVEDETDCMLWEEPEKSAFLQEAIQYYKDNGSFILYSFVENSIQYDENGKVSEIRFKK